MAVAVHLFIAVGSAIQFLLYQAFRICLKTPPPEFDLSECLTKLELCFEGLPVALAPEVATA